MTFSENYYQLLQVPHDADRSILRKAFHQLSKELHPDTTSLPQDIAARKFQQVCEAYEFLNDPELRKVYDIRLAQEQDQSNFLSDATNSVKTFKEQSKVIDIRRPFSGGELFSLLLLGLAILISLLVGIVLGLVQGRELLISPSWLTVCYESNSLFSNL